MHHIMVVDDDITNTKLLRFLLMDEGYEVTAFNSSKDALAAAQRDTFDLFLLDIVMPGMTGIELCQNIRQVSQSPIIFLSSKDSVADKIHGLKIGADDYISKPFDPNEVLARTWAALRRSNQAASTESSLRTVDFVLDAVENKVSLVKSGKAVNLSPTETRLLHVLMANAGRTLTRDTIVIKVWSYDYEHESNQLDVYMKRLRVKVEPDPRHPKLLVTIRGVGYKYQPSNIVTS